MTAPVLTSTLDREAPDAKVRFEHNKSLAAELRSTVAAAALGGSEGSRERHVGRGKLLPRERVERLLDPGSPFLEIGQLAANGMYGKDAINGAGLIAGIGRVSGRQVMIVCNDATVKGGTYYPMTVKKHLRAQEIAQETACRASTSSTAAVRIFRTRRKSSPIATISAASFSTRPI